MLGRKMKSNSYRAIVLAGIVAMTGCVAHKMVTIDTVPEGARIALDGQDAGPAPIQKDLQFKDNHVYDVVASLPGYEDAKSSIAYEPPAETDFRLNLTKKVRVMTKFIEIEPTVTDQGIALIPQEKEAVAYLETIERSASVPSVTQMTYNMDDSTWIGKPVVSPVSDVFVYPIVVQDTIPPQDGELGHTIISSNLWKQNVASAAKTRLTFGKWQDIYPAFSPDANLLLFSSDRSGKNKTLWEIKTEGSGGITKITNSDSADYCPSMASTDMIAYSSLPPRADSAQVWTVRRDGSLPTQLREGDVPQISIDGQKILFTRLATEPNAVRNKRLKQLWVMSADGGGETLLTSDINGDVIDPRFSPDGRWIVFACDEGKDSTGENNFDIWIMSADGARRSQLTTNGSRDDGPCFDRNQEFVYFRSNRGGRFNIWRLPMQFIGVRRAYSTPMTVPSP
jgi:WD40 repeat protein